MRAGGADVWGAGWGGAAPKWLDTTFTSPQSTLFAGLVADVSS